MHELQLTHYTTTKIILISQHFAANELYVVHVGRWRMQANGGGEGVFGGAGLTCQSACAW